MDMSDYCVVVVDSTRARLFTLEAARVPEVESGPKLTEQKDLVNPEKGMQDRDVPADTRSGVNRAPQGGSGQSYDDHRTQHEHEFDRRFAKTVVAEVLSLVKSARARFLVLAAEPQMLALMRKESGDLSKSGIEVREAATNLTKFPVQEIQAHLPKQKLVPECKRPGAVR